MINEKQKVAGLSVVAAVFLTSIKLVIGIVTGSLGLISEALHSGLDQFFVRWFVLEMRFY